jgi:hypothetical protein
MRLLLATGFLLLALAAPAAAAPAWLPPTPLGADVAQVSSNGRIAVAPDGSAVAAWAQALPTGTDFVLQYSRRPPGGRFSAPVTVGGTTGAGSVDVAVDREGSATIAFLQGTTVRAMRVPRSGAPSAPETIDTDGSFLSLAVGIQGRAVLAYVKGFATAPVVRSAVRSGATGEFPDPQTISQVAGAAETSDVDAAVGDTGAAAVVWTRKDGTGRTVVEANTREPNGNFTALGGSISDTTPGFNADQGAVAIDATGRTTALWRDATRGRIAFAERPAGGASSWSPPDFASAGTEVAERPDVGVAPNGTAVGVWVLSNAGTGIVEAGLRAAGGGAFGDLRKLSGPSMNVFDPIVSVGRGGDAMFVWGTSMGEAVFALHRSRTGKYSDIIPAVTENNPPPNQELAFFNPSVGIDDQGNAFAAFTRDAFHKMPPLDGMDHYTFEVAAFDFAAPSLTASVPPNGVASLPVGMAAAASDRLTATSISWNFGDGGTATGGAVQHAFGAPGAFDVTVTAKDGVGNAVSRTAPVLVAAPPPPPRIDSAVSVKWGRQGRFVYLVAMRVVRPPAGTKVQLRCKGKKCPFKQKTYTRFRKGSIRVAKELKPAKVVKKKARRFRRGQRVQLRITAEGFIGKVVNYKMPRTGTPTGKIRCLPIGATKPRKTC